MNRFALRARPGCWMAGLLLGLCVGAGGPRVAEGQALAPRPVYRSALGAQISGTRVPCQAGRAGAFPCSNVDLLAYLPIESLGGSAGVMLNDIWGWTDPATGQAFALVGRTDGTAFVDVSDPVNARYVGSLPMHAGARASAWRDVKVYAGHAFIVADNAGDHGLQVYDLTQLPTAVSPQIPFTETAHHDGFGSAHNIAINEASGYAYVVGIGRGRTTCGGGLYMLDVRDPARPTFAGCFAEAGYIHDVQCVTYQGPDAEHQGKEICFASAERRVAVVDVTDKTAPRLLSTIDYPGVGYVHQGWLTEDHRYFLQDDELDELNQLAPRTRTMFWDMADLDDPVLLHQFLGRTPATDHNLYVKGDAAYQANYKSGLRILSIQNIASPREVAFFDTYPDANTPGFEGAWSNYPFFESGIVVVSSIGEGLFVLQPTGLGNLAAVAFNAVVRGDDVDFTWTLEGDDVGLRFEVEEYVGTTEAGPQWIPVGTLSGTDVAEASSYSLLLEDIFPGAHLYRLKVTDAGGGVLYSSEIPVQVAVPGLYALAEAYPNPFQEAFQFQLALRQEERVSVAVYDALGRRVAQLHEGPLRAGEAHRFTFTAPPGLAAGSYVLRVVGQSFADTRLVTRVR